jgi:protoporphyrinogen oxidase
MATHVTVLGAGLAGLAAAQRCRQLGAAVDVYERNAYLGGHASSMTLDGFTFDEGPHVSFTKIPAVKDLLARGVDGDYREFASVVTNYWRGHWVKHPAQVNLHGLPVELVERCLVDFTKAYFVEEGPPGNYEEWLHRQLGRTFSEEFPFRYTRKYWTVEPSAMATEWVGPRMYKPKLEEVIRGALASNRENVHYIPKFRYPNHGGFASYVRAVQGDEPVHIGHELTELDPHRKVLRFTNGKEARYERLISSLPLPELVRRINDAPAEVRAAAEGLVCTSVALVDVGVARDQGFPEAHWLYVYDEDICFARASYPHLLSPHNVPPGCGSVQVEVYYSRHKPLPSRDMLSRGVEDMRSVGILRKDDAVRVAQVRNIPYGNVLFDHARAAHLAAINDYLKKIGITCCGRYGLWNYHWTDESIVSGWEAAEQILGATAGDGRPERAPAERRP